MSDAVADHDVAVVGAGAAGIGAARRLIELGLEVIVIEARERIGGRALRVPAPPRVVVALRLVRVPSPDRQPPTSNGPRRGLLLPPAVTGFGVAVPRGR